MSTVSCTLISSTSRNNFEYKRKIRVNRINRQVFIRAISIGMCIFTSSSMAFDLDGMLKQVQQAVEIPQQTATPASQQVSLPAPAVQQIIPTQASQIISIPEVISPAEYCERVTTDLSVTQFSDYFNNVFNGLRENRYVISEVIEPNLLDLDIDLYAGYVAYPDNPDLIKNWEYKKLKEISDVCHENIDANECKSLVNMIGGYTPTNPSDNAKNLFRKKFVNSGDGLVFQDAYFKAVYEQCGNKLIASKLNGTVLISQLRITEFNKYYSALDTCQKSETKKEKRVLEDGSVQTIDLPKDCTEEESALSNIFVEASILPKVLMFKNGDKLFHNASNDSLNILKPKLQKLLKEGSSVLAANKLLKDKIEKMKISGDFSSANNCDEVADALNIKPSTIGEVFHGSYIAKINATNFYYRVGGSLDQLTGDNGYLKGSERNEFAGITVSKKAVWIQKNNIGMKSPVLTVGKYISNKTISLTSGKSLTIPVYELVCISPSGAVF